jgi:hypothetical protein
MYHMIIRSTWIGWSIWIFIMGIIDWIDTMGTVYGSSFGMLITLVNIGAMGLVWLFCLTLYLVTLPQRKKTATSEN